MNNVTYEQFFATLSGNSRLDILKYLQNHGSQNVSQIAVGTGQEQSAISHSLNKLLACECVHVEVRGKNRYYSLNGETVTPILEMADQHIQKFCQGACKSCKC